VVPNSTPARIVDYEARFAYLVKTATILQLANQASRPEPDFILDIGDNVYNGKVQNPSPSPVMAASTACQS